MQRGLFIAIEGIDACGKGTIATRLATELFNANKEHHILLTRAPYQREWLKKFLSQLDPIAHGDQALALFVKDRTEHCKMIEAALKKGAIVLSDRYKHSTYAYQTAQGVPFDKIHAAHKPLLVPDLTIILDIPAAEAHRRMTEGRKTDAHAFHDETFLTRVRDNYLSLKEKLTENIVIVNAHRDRDSVFTDAHTHVRKLIATRRRA